MVGCPSARTPRTAAQTRQREADEAGAAGLLHLVAEYESRSQYLSPHANSPTNTYGVMRDDPAFKALGLSARDVRRVLAQCQRSGWIESAK